MVTSARPKRPTGRPRQDDRQQAAKKAAAAARRSNELAQANREIGPIPKIANVRRRESCRLDFKRFCTTYNREAFFLPWGPDQDESAATLEETVLHGALYANAEPRGSGKTTRARMATLWAVSYGHWHYPFVIGANAQKARDTLEAIKIFVRSLPRYVADFPEISYPVRKLGGVTHKAPGQLCKGELTGIQWGLERVVLPTVPPPANWPSSWPLRSDGMVPTSGAIIGVSGLTGEGIRGSLLTTTTGEQVRPDGVLLDDPQTDESAASPIQNQARESLISGAVLGMAGPGRSIAAIMACTPIRPGDMADRMLDRVTHPLWRGRRMKMLRSMPSDLQAWEKYFVVYRACAQKSPPDYSEANAYYVEHRAELDAGAEAAWEARKRSDEVSAIQHAMNLYARDRRAFMAEYQCEPQPDDDPGRVAMMTSDDVSAKVNRIPRGKVPLPATLLTAAVDIQHTLLYWLVAAWEDDFTGYVVDYGAWPDQRRAYFAAADARVTLESAVHGGSLEANVYQGLERLADHLLGLAWRREDGAEMQIGRLLVDASDGALTDTIYQFVRQSKWPGVLIPFHGRAATAGRDYYGTYKKKPGERVGLNWIIPTVKGTRATRHVYADTNFWKTFVQARLAVPLGGRGCLSLFGSEAGTHRMLADHVTAERAVRTENKNTGRQVNEWTNPSRADNHLGDCLVYAAVAASIEGVALPEGQPGRQGPDRRQRMKLSERQRVRA